MKRCILHIGMPKTGSSALQDFLHRNRAALGEAGILYPLTRPWPPNAHGELGRIFYRAHAGRTDLRRKALAHLERRIAEMEGAGGQGDVLILSSEALFDTPRASNAAAILAEFLERLGYRLEIVVAIRPQAAFLNSKYAQLAGSLMRPQPFADYLNQMLGGHALDYNRRLKPWAGIAGGRIRPLAYAGSARAAIVERFLAETGLADRVADLALENPPVRHNPTSGPLTVETFRRLAGAAEWKPNSDAVHWARRDLVEAAAARGWDETPFVGLTRDMRERVRAAFAEPNERFAKRHWGKGWDAVFEPLAEAEPDPNSVETAPPGAEDRAELERLVTLLARRYGDMGPVKNVIQRTRLRLKGKSAINRRAEDLFNFDDE